MQEKESKLNVLSMNFRKEIEMEHGEEIQKKRKKLKKYKCKLLIKIIFFPYLI